MQRLFHEQGRATRGWKVLKRKESSQKYWYLNGFTFSHDWSHHQDFANKCRTLWYDATTPTHPPTRSHTVYTDYQYQNHLIWQCVFISHIQHFLIPLPDGGRRGRILIWKENWIFYSKKKKVKSISISFVYCLRGY